MRKEDIIKIRDGKQRAYENNERWYQQSGEASYARAARRYEDLVDICNQALSSADDHTKCISLSADLITLGNKAADLNHKRNTNQKVDTHELWELVKRVLSIARLHGFDDKWG